MKPKLLNHIETRINALPNHLRFEKPILKQLMTGLDAIYEKHCFKAGLVDKTRNTPIVTQLIRSCMNRFNLDVSFEVSQSVSTEGCKADICSLFESVLSEQKMLT